ncbi:MAG: inositol monophosphatase, partial [Bdellovibrionaceae bacterium]|nr:inositol monophosphatase [Pseudobdellovibrionaceae bacterium]
MDPVKIAEYLRISKEACAVGREVLMYYFGRLENIQSKDKAGLVSEADVECEKVIADYLSCATPEFG